MQAILRRAPLPGIAKRGKLSDVRGLSSDIRYALRTLRHGGTASVIAVLSLAVGVGTNAAIFSAGYAMLARPLPYPGADRLVLLRSTNPSHGVLWTTSAPANLLDWQARATSFEAIAGYRFASVDLTGGDHSQRLRGLFTTSEFFGVLGVPVRGKTFDVEIFNPASPQRRKPEMIMGRGLWQRRFGSDPGMLGRVVDVNLINLSRVGTTPVFVDGLAAADVHFPPLSADFNLGAGGIDDVIDFWMPEARDPTRRDSGDLDVIARLRQGVTLEQAQSEMDTISRALEAAHRDTNSGLTVRVVPLRDQMLGGSRRVLLLLFAATGLVLLVACGNVANLLLARAAARQKEVAIRAALGAARRRILRQFLVESASIAIPAAAIGVALAYATLALLRPLIPSDVPFAKHATMDDTVLLFTMVVASLTAVITGIVPALRASAAQPGDAMKQEGRSATAGRRRQRLVAMLVASEVAMTLMLLIATGLMVKSANHVWRVDPGFDPQQLLTMTISLPNNKFEWRHNVVFSRQVIGSITAMPGVRSAAVIQGVPMAAGSFFTSFSIPGRPDTPVDRPSGRLRVVSPGYIGVMRIPLLAGRDYDEHDEVGAVGSLPSVIVNRTLAERFWPGQDAVGKQVQMSWRNSPSTVIGVVGDVRYTGLDADPGNEFYLPEGLYPQSAITLLARTDRDPLALAPAIRSRITAIDKDAFVFDVKPMTQLMTESLAPRRFATTLLSAFAGVALVLSLAGIYAVIGHSVAQRTVEIGIRIAVGASPTRVTRLMLRDALVPVLGGMALGWSGAWAMSRLFAAMLFEVAPLDLPTWVPVSVAVLAVACAAGYLPARRAGRVEPTVALRAE
jgi:putative ABC transport system permease protein